MKKYLLPALLMAATTAFAADSQSGTGETDGFKLVWQDLFDFGTLNPDRWNIEVNGSGGGNNELQYYTESHLKTCSVGDDGRGNGCLILTARREDYIQPQLSPRDASTPSAKVGRSPTAKSRPR